MVRIYDPVVYSAVSCEPAATGIDVVAREPRYGISVLDGVAHRVSTRVLHTVVRRHSSDCVQLVLPSVEWFEKHQPDRVPEYHFFNRLELACKHSFPPRCALRWFISAEKADDLDTDMLGALRAVHGSGDCYTKDGYLVTPLPLSGTLPRDLFPVCRYHEAYLEVRPMRHDDTIPEHSPFAIDARSNWMETWDFDNVELRATTYTLVDDDSVPRWRWPAWEPRFDLSTCRVEWMNVCRELTTTTEAGSIRCDMVWFTFPVYCLLVGGSVLNNLKSVRLVQANGEVLLREWLPGDDCGADGGYMVLRVTPEMPGDRSTGALTHRHALELEFRGSFKGDERYSAHIYAVTAFHVVTLMGMIGIRYDGVYFQDDE